ncbi:phosphohydrolase [Acidocella aquatica]|uniref:Phosphohydrolase n=1 Tax=Acidocella aquatica TaxID=1922313 RepID=A0ABQ6A9V1_9PROT|nr:HD family hydrolase [Acidocella aquatica]GLR66899.1 phosphohydrolase [Acidocella aquatica]
MKTIRAWVRLSPSGRQLNLLDPDPDTWNDADVAVGLSRTYRWGGHSAWDLPLSVAQHSLTVLAIRQAQPGAKLTRGQALRELLHDADEGFLSFDCITPVKPHLGDGYASLVARLQAAIVTRYQLPAWSADEHAQHKQADRLAAASEALNVVGWSAHDIRHTLEIETPPLSRDPLTTPVGMRAWQPWPPQLAAELFLQELTKLSAGRNGRGPAGEMEAPYP